MIYWHHGNWGKRKKSGGPGYGFLGSAFDTFIPWPLSDVHWRRCVGSGERSGPGLWIWESLTYSYWWSYEGLEEASTEGRKEESSQTDYAGPAPVSLGESQQHYRGVAGQRGNVNLPGQLPEPWQVPQWPESGALWLYFTYSFAFIPSSLTYVIRSTCLPLKVECTRYFSRIISTVFWFNNKIKQPRLRSTLSCRLSITGHIRGEMQHSHEAADQYGKSSAT